MVRFAAVAVALSLAGCSSSDAPPPDDITGPYTGAITRYVVDRLVLPTTSTSVREIADDLDGDQTPDNQLGGTLASLNAFGNLTTHAPDMIASGALASIVQIQADDLTTDDTVRVWYDGADGDEAEAVGGAIVDGAFQSNRTRTTWAPGAARLRLPVFVDADPIAVDLIGLEIDMTPDGKGGYDAIIRGGVPEQQAREAAYGGILQMFAANPPDHRTFWYLADLNRDGDIPFDEMNGKDGLLSTLLTSDLEIRPRDGRREPVVSLAFLVHLSPCPAGDCARGTIPDTCHDRVHDGDETGVDCGGSCLACAGGTACVVGPDCQSGSCTNGQCLPPTCIDGIRDGFESDVDCSGGCGLCASQKSCEFSTDCLRQYCQADRCY
jgi:hypothetical protein